MEEAKRYIPDNCVLVCDKGQLPTQIRVTHSNNCHLYGELFVTEADIIPNENIPPFGICSLTHKPCRFNPLYWDKCAQGVKVNGHKLVFEDACLICKEGGKITADFNIPSSGMLSGLGLSAPLQWIDYDRCIGFVQDRVLYGVEKGVIVLNTTARTGNYGEMAANRLHAARGMRNIRSEHPIVDIDKPTARGFDAAYVKDGEYVVDEVKPWKGDPAKTEGYGKQLSQDWVQKHLDDGAVPNNHSQAMTAANKNGTLKRTVTHYEAGGRMKISSYKTKGSDNVVSTRHPEHIANPPTKAAGHINKIRLSLANRKPIIALANSNFSKGIQNSAGAKKASDAIWKVTQTIGESPALRTVGKVVGRSVVVVGVAMDSYNIYSAYKEEGRFGDKTQQATGSALGGAGFGWLGAEAGAIVGSAICPGPGTLIGAVIGGVVGAIAGSLGGSSFMDWVFND